MKYIKFIVLAIYLFVGSALAHGLDNKYNAYVLSVYDGDTIRVDIDLGLDVVLSNQPIRLYGINAPEMRGVEKVQGTISRDWLIEQIDKKNIVLETINDDKGKYGRLLGIIWFNGRNINQELVDLGLAKKHDY